MSVTYLLREWPGDLHVAALPCVHRVYQAAGREGQRRRRDGKERALTSPWFSTPIATPH